jgi:hypothetical protein
MIGTIQTYKTAMASSRPRVSKRPGASAALPAPSREQVALRKELKRLTDERDDLKLQLRQRSQHHLRSGAPSGSPRDREYCALAQEVVAMRAELTLLLRSDNALQRDELQEEAKVLYQEWCRLQDLTIEQQIALSDAKKERDDGTPEDAPATYDRQAKQIAELTAKVARYEHANVKLAQKIKKLRAAKGEAAGDSGEEIAQQIEHVEKETTDVEERIRRAKENHQKVMSALQASLGAAGAAREDDA